MKPFDIEKALDGEPVVSRSGEPVTELTLFYATKEEYCLRGVLEHEIMGWSVSGEYDKNIENHSRDLFMAEPERWVNIHFNAKPQRFFGGLIYESEADALKDKDKMPNYQATIKLKDSTKEN